MTEAVGASAPAATGTLVSAKTVVASNIIAALGLKATEEKIAAVEQTVEDEMTAMQQHFALAVQDIKHAYDTAVADFQSSYSFVARNKIAVGLVALALLILGAVIGHKL